ncbi:MAG: zf-HC2 domain-containing protein [Actinomycetota bacterium]
MSTDEFALHDAAYVLGALSPVERREFEEHLKVCASCASSVGALAGLPGLMSAVSLEELTAEVEAPPETLLPSLARAVRRERGRRRLFVGTSAAAAAVLIAVGAAALNGADSPAQPPAAPTASTVSGSANLAMTAVVPSPVTASARLVDMAWGTRIDLTCSYSAKGSFPAAGYPYALVVIDRGGAVQQVATWKALPDRQLTIRGASSLARKDLAAVEVRTLSGVTLLRLST